ncbi:hypothetical protein [Microbacterium sp. SS28]|uniref:hypothetical protein n=1 Tax=Microbacterium sp. SS28 TaxID=2919948 RepID=UPI001FAA4DDB|nr:hypothetical protein [Microbacterium sp. SS28]
MEAPTLATSLPAIIIGTLAVWLLVSLFVAHAIGRSVAVGEYQREMDVLYRPAPSGGIRE